jgi:predicted dehydrogenase
MLIAVLGCGSIGIRHIQNILHLNYRDLIAFDPLLQARHKIEKEIKIPVLGSLAEVWEHKPDVAFITAPTDQHIELGCQAARQGCHLFIEKPLSHSMDKIALLLDEVKKRGLITMVGCNMRFHPGPLTVKKMIEIEAIGKPIAARIQTGSYLPNWRPWQDFRQGYSASPESGGALLDCIHEIDLALWYFGRATVLGSVSLPATSIGLKTDGLSEILLRHASGVVSSVHLNFIQRDYRRSCQIIGSEGTIYWDFGDHQVTVYGADGKLAQQISEPEDWQMNNMYLDELSHFLGSVQALTPTLNPLAGGMAALDIALTVRGTQGYCS